MKDIITYINESVFDKDISKKNAIPWEVIIVNFVDPNICGDDLDEYENTLDVLNINKISNDFDPIPEEELVDTTFGKNWENYTYKSLYKESPRVMEIFRIVLGALVTIPISEEQSLDDTLRNFSKLFNKKYTNSGGGINAQFDNFSKRVTVRLHSTKRGVNDLNIILIKK